VPKKYSNKFDPQATETKLAKLYRPWYTHCCAMRPNTYLNYRLTDPPARLRRARLDNITLIPASALPHLDKYKAMARRLPRRSVLIVSPQQGRVQKILDAIARGFKEHSWGVTTIPARIAV